MKKLMSANNAALAVLTMLSLSTVGCADGTAVKSETSDATSTSASIQPTRTPTETLRAQIESETGVTTLVEATTDDQKAAAEFAMTEFLKAVRERKPDLQGYTTIFFTATADTKGAAVQENAEKNLFLTVRFNRTREAILHSLQYFPRERRDLANENIRLRQQLEQYLDITVTTSDFDAVATNWALKSLKGIALGSVEGNKKVRALKAVDFTFQNSFSSHETQIETLSMNEAELKNFVLVDVPKMRDRLEKAKSRLNHVAMTTRRPIYIFSENSEEIEAVAIALEAESKVPNHGLGRIERMIVGSENTIVVSSYLWKQSFGVRLAAKTEAQRVQMKNMLARLRDGVYINCKVPGTKCVKANSRDAELSDLNIL